MQRKMYSLPVLIIGTYDKDGNVIGEIVNVSADELVLEKMGIIVWN